LEQRQRVYTDARARNPQRPAKGTRNWTPVAKVRLNPDRLETKTKAARLTHATTILTRVAIEYGHFLAN
jgi:hypothetical protein